MVHAVGEAPKRWRKDAQRRAMLLAERVKSHGGVGNLSVEAGGDAGVIIRM